MQGLGTVKLTDSIPILLIATLPKLLIFGSSLNQTCLENEQIPVHLTVPAGASGSDPVPERLDLERKLPTFEITTTISGPTTLLAGRHVQLKVGGDATDGRESRSLALALSLWRLMPSVRCRSSFNSPQTHLGTSLRRRGAV